MSFGCGIGDIIQLTTITWRLYKSCKEASKDFVDLSKDIASLHVVLSEIHDFLSEDPGIDTSRRNRLSVLCDACQGVLTDIEALYIKYDRLGTKAQRAWDQARFGLEDLQKLRVRVVSSVTLLSGWNTAVTKYDIPIALSPL